MNNMQSLHDKLFAQLDRLSNAEGEALDVEIKRTDAVCDVANCIIANGNLVLRVAIAQSEQIACNKPLPKMLGVSSE